MLYIRENSRGLQMKKTVPGRKPNRWEVTKKKVKYHNIKVHRGTLLY